MIKIGRRFIFIGCMVLILLLSGCSRKDTKVLNILNWSSYIPDSVIREFEKETGIRWIGCVGGSNFTCRRMWGRQKLY